MASFFRWFFYSQGITTAIQSAYWILWILTLDALPDVTLLGICLLLNW